MANENENEKKVSQQDTPPVVDQKKDALEESKSLIKMADKLKQAQENSVSKEEYDKVVAAKEELEGYILEGKELQRKNETSKKSIADLRKELTKEGITNLDYISTSLELRKMYLEKEGRDIFAANSEDAPKAQRVAETLEGYVKQANGNPAVFNALLEQNVTDDPTLLANLAK